LIIICLPASIVVKDVSGNFATVLDGERGKRRNNTSNYPITQDIMDGFASITFILRTRAFWHICIAFVCQIFIVMTVTTHILPYLTSVGISRAMGAFIASGAPLMSIIGRLLFGLLGDKYNVRRISAACFVLMGISLICYVFISTGFIWLLIPYALFYGIGFGGNFTINAVIVRKYFGIARFGRIHGIISGIAVIGAVVGPPIAGWVFDSFGSFRIVWLALAFMSAAAAIIMITAPSEYDYRKMEDK